ETGFFDERLQFTCRHGKAMAELACGQIGEILGRQGLEREAGSSRHYREAAFIGTLLDFKLSAIGQLAHDVVQYMRRGRGAAVTGDLGCHGFHDFDVEIGGGEPQRTFGGLDQHVRQYGNRIATLHHALNMAQSMQEGRAFDRDAHSCCPLGADQPTPPGVPPMKGGTTFARIRRQGKSRPGLARDYCCSIKRTSNATSRARCSSVRSSSSILRTAWSTVE